MAKQDNKKESSEKTIGFRTKSLRQKKNFQDRSKTLKSKGITKADIFEAGLLALENGSSEEQLLRKKNFLINKRNEALKEASDSNKRIEAYNRQLKDRYSSRYENLPIEDNVIIIKIVDSSGAEKEL